MNKKIQQAIFAIALFCATLGTVKSQVSPAIDYLPYQANGYLVMKKLSYPTVREWRLEIQEKSLNATGDEYVYQTVYTTTIDEKGYLHIPDQYAGGNHYLKATGLDAGNNIVVNIDPEPVGPGPFYEVACVKTCIGSTYAYEIELSVSPDNSNSNMMVQSTSVSADVYHYQYMSIGEFNTTNSLWACNYYGIPIWQYNGTGVGTKIIKLDGVTNSDNIKDQNGFSLNGTVYGVRKYLGNWVGSVLFAEDLIGGDSHCAQTLGFFISQINLHANFGSRPPLTCDGGGYSGPGTMPGETESFDPCTEESIALWTNDTAWDEPYNPFGLMEELADCMQGGGITHPVWPSNVAVVNIQPLYDPNGGTTVPVTSLKPNDFIAANGEFTSPDISLQPGLHIIGIQFTDGSYRSVFFDVEDAVIYKYPHSNAVDINIYPVPVQNGEFDIEFESGVNISFDYRLSDLQGNSIHTERITLTGGQTKVVHIKPRNGIPSGQLSNQFVFNDGSRINIQTVAN